MGTAESGVEGRRSHERVLCIDVSSEFDQDLNAFNMPPYSCNVQRRLVDTVSRRRRNAQQGDQIAYLVRIVLLCRLQQLIRVCGIDIHRHGESGRWRRILRHFRWFKCCVAALSVVFLQYWQYLYRDGRCFFVSVFSVRLSLLLPRDRRRVFINFFPVPKSTNESSTYRYIL